MSSRAEVEVRFAERRRRVDEWALVLASQGLSARVQGREGGFVVLVPLEQAVAAVAVLDAYERENPPGPPGPQRVASPADLRVGLAVPAVLVAFFFVTGPRDPDVVWFRSGSADAARILDGELWRSVTALTLHADTAHVVANALIGALFLTAACRTLGAGLACLLLVLSGAGGNLANAWMHASNHVSVGASTAVFGCVGVMGGVGVARRQHGGTRGRRAWLPVAASLGLLAMLGVGARVDLWAHLLGLAVGAALGLGVGARLPHPPRPAAQWLMGGAAAAIVLWSWSVALALPA